MWSLNSTVNNTTEERSNGIPIKNMNNLVGVLLDYYNKSNTTSNIQTTVSSTIPTTYNNNGIIINTYTINLKDVVDIESSDIPEIININGTTFSKSNETTISLLVPNSFTYNPITKEITLATRPNSKEEIAIRAGLPFDIIIYNNPIATDYINPSTLPDILKGIPLRGSIQITLSFEQHPNASLELITDYRYIDLFRRAFIGGTELIIYNIGFRVNSTSIKAEPRSNSPNMEYTISVSLGGKWENYTDKEVNLKNSNLSNLGLGYIGADNSDIDQECRKPDTSTVNRNSRTVPLSLLTIPIGAFICGINAYVEIDKNTPLDTWINWFSVFQEHLRINKCFMVLSNPNCVQGKNIKAVNTFRIKDESVISYDGTSINSKLRRNFPKFNKPIENYTTGTELPSYPIGAPTIPNKKEDTNLIPYGAEYRNTKLDGRFNNPLDNDDAEETQGGNFKEQKPSWRRKTPERITTKQGDLYAHVAPPYTIGNTEGYDLSLNWDSSGPTKVLRINVSENGSPISEEVYTYGFCYTAAEIKGLDKNGDPVSKKPLLLAWGLVQKEVTEHYYDEETGYYLGCETNGWAMRRFRQENTSEPETVIYAYERLRIAKELEDGVKYSRNEEDNSIISTPLTEAEIEEYHIEDKYYQALIEACLPRQVKSVSKTMLSLEPFHKYYPDTQLGGYELYQICLPNGKLGYGLVNDPSWVPPHFVAFEYRETNSFDKMGNPENILRKWEYDKTINQRLPTEPEEYVPLPPLTVGEESHFVQETVVYPKDQQHNWQLSSLSVKEAKVDRYTKYSNEYSGQDSQFYASLHNTKFEECIGRPSEATKKDLGWEKVEPEQPKDNPPDLTNGLVSGANSAIINIPAVPVGKSECNTEPVNIDSYKQLTTTTIEPIRINSAIYTVGNNTSVKNHKLNQSQYDYYMASPGVSTTNEAPEGSQSYTYARTLQQAIDGAQTDLYINNVQNTLSTSFTIPLNLNIREFDRIELTINGEVMLRRVLSVSHSIEIHGLLEGQPFTTGVTTITCGLDRCVNFNVYRKVRPDTLNNAANKPKDNTNPQVLSRFILLDNKPIEMGGLVKIEKARRTYYDY